MNRIRALPRIVQIALAVIVVSCCCVGGLGSLLDDDEGTPTPESVRARSVSTRQPTQAPSLATYAQTRPTDTQRPVAHTPQPSPTPGSAGADLVVAFNPGPGAKPRYTDPAKLLGEPDLIEDPCCKGMTQLGRRGSILLAFTDNSIIDRNGPDFQVFGESAKDDFLLVEVSADGRTWKAFPKLSESPGALDLSDVGLDKAIFVRVTDVQPGTATGAELDAVIALHNAAGVGDGLPTLPDAVARRDLVWYEEPDSEARELGEVSAGEHLSVIGRSETGEWVKVKKANGESGWFPVRALGLNVDLSDYSLIGTLTAVAPTATPPAAATTVPKPTKAPPSTPVDQVLADSLADFTGGQGQNSWEYLFSEGRDTFNWKQMGFDGACYQSPFSEERLRICADHGAPGANGDIAWLYKAERTGRLLFKVTTRKTESSGDDISIRVFRHTTRLKTWALDAGNTQGFTRQFELSVNGGEMIFFTMQVDSTWREFRYDPNFFRVRVYLLNTSTPVPATPVPPPSSNCSPCYPDVCIPPAPPDLDCDEIGYTYFRVVGCDPHGFDGDSDGIGCER